MKLACDPEWPEVLRDWGSLVPPQAVPEWSAVVTMIEAARPAMETKAGDLQSLLESSRARFDPLSERLDLDLGLHRWLDAEREEAYSDWLEWVVRQAETPVRIFRLFGLQLPDGLSAGARLDVEREPRVAHGHDEREGRLDLRISFDDRPSIIVEVKKGDADDADTAKHAGYLKSHSNVEGILLAISATELNYHGFAFRSWANVCVEMRLLAIELCKFAKKRLAAAMVLAFVAAVEQNLLGLSAASERLFFVRSSVVDHLGDFLKKVEQ